MWFFFLGIFLGIGIYWTIAIILVGRVLDRRLDRGDYLPKLCYPEVVEHNQQ